MTGPPEHAGPPEWVEPHGRDGVETTMQGRDPPFGARFKRGGETVEERVAEVRTDRGAEIVELVLSNGRTVTVNAERELEGVR